MIDVVNSFIHSHMHSVHFYLSQAHKLSTGISPSSLIDSLSFGVLLAYVSLK